MGLWAGGPFNDPPQVHFASEWGSLMTHGLKWYCSVLWQLALCGY